MQDITKNTSDNVGGLQAVFIALKTELAPYLFFSAKNNVVIDFTETIEIWKRLPYEEGTENVNIDDKPSDNGLSHELKLTFTLPKERPEVEDWILNYAEEVFYLLVIDLNDTATVWGNSDKGVTVSVGSRNGNKSNAYQFEFKAKQINRPAKYQAFDISLFFGEFSNDFSTDFAV
jgi:hypothetical protein